MSTLLNGNIFTMQADDERRLAHRGEIKRALAEIAVRKQRIAELQNIVKRLDADSETAADSHSEQAGRLQEELKGIDQQHVHCILGSTELPAKVVERRSAILDEIVQLNRLLEDRCESNKRASVPIKREIQELTMQVTSEGALKNQLAALCSPELRRKRLANGHRMKFAIGAADDAARMVAIFRHNTEVHQLSRNVTDEAIAKVRLADWQAVAAECQAEVQRLRDADVTIEAEALAEE